MSKVLQRSTTLSIAAAIVLIDQLSKAALSAVLVDGKTMTAIPGILSLQLVHNSGAAFSLFSRSTELLGLLSLLVSVGILVWIGRQRAIPLWQGLATACLLGGTLGNGLDRWRLGYVVDFLALVPINFPIFNGADIAINFAVLFFGLDLWLNRQNGEHG
jgi:signal peptidase II